MSKSPKAFARRRQTVERYGVLAGDRQLVITIIQQTATQKLGDALENRGAQARA